MDIALGSMRARKIPMLKANGLHWILDQNVRPAILVGYGSDDPEKMSSIHHIIKFHYRKRPIFNVVSAMEDYSVKHTRVATPNVAIFDDRIPVKEPRAARDFLQEQYIDLVVDIAKAFRERGLEVPPVDQFESGFESGAGKKTKTKVVANPKARSAKARAKVATAKKNKRVRFITEIEDDEEDGPIRRLTPIKKHAPATQSASQKSPERQDSIMTDACVKNEFGSPICTSTIEGCLMLDLDKDTPMPSIEDENARTPARDATDSPMFVPQLCTVQEALCEPC